MSRWARLSDAELIAHYESAKETRHPDLRSLLRAIEVRASREGTVENHSSRIGYRWTPALDSVVRFTMTATHASYRRLELERRRKELKADAARLKREHLKSLKSRAG